MLALSTERVRRRHPANNHLNSTPHSTSPHLTSTRRWWLESAPAGAMHASAKPLVLAAQDPLQAKYSLEQGDEFLGGGGFGQVFTGTRLVDGRNYAVKFVDSRDARWKQEYQLLSGMRHDNVLRAIEMFEPNSKRACT